MDPQLNSLATYKTWLLLLLKRMEKTQNKKAEEFKKRVLQVVSVMKKRPRICFLIWQFSEQHRKPNCHSSDDQRKLGDVFSPVDGG
jgi:hypothetical protein